MKRIFEVAKHNPLFQGIAFSDFEKMLTCLSAKTMRYHKDAVILLSGDAVHFVGLILSGSILIIKEDIEGRRTILTEHSVAETFGEVFACAGISQSPVTILAAEASEVLLIDYRRIITTCTAACPFHALLIENMLRLVAVNNLMLNQKIDILSKRSTREKLLQYFDTQRGVAKKFTLPFNREELAHYLCVDRSALSNELSKMRKEGLIDFHRNQFELL
ncbi:MAG: Crp/Fnr family transcriptional regulator [Coriobacteriia bacterium]|nr:Crp/Fnr family transcriptional regulator [Coriobacteriia bacterium]